MLKNCILKRSIGILLIGIIFLNSTSTLAQEANINDFDSFVNEKVYKENPNTYNLSRIAATNNRNFRIDTINTLVENIPSIEKDSDIECVAKYYSSYMDKKLANEQGVTPLLPYLKIIENTKSYDDIKNAGTLLYDKGFFLNGKLDLILRGTGLTNNDDLPYWGISDNITLNDTQKQAVKNLYKCIEEKRQNKFVNKIYNLIYKDATESAKCSEIIDRLNDLKVFSLNIKYQPVLNISKFDELKNSFTVNELKTILKIGLELDSVNFLGDDIKNSLFDTLGTIKGYRYQSILNIYSDSYPIAEYPLFVSSLHHIVNKHIIDNRLKTEDTFKEISNRKEDIANDVKTALIEIINENDNLNTPTKESMINTIQNVNVLFPGFNNYNDLFPEIKIQNYLFKTYKEGGSFLENALQARIFNNDVLNALSNNLDYENKKDIINFFLKLKVAIFGMQLSVPNAFHFIGGNISGKLVIYVNPAMLSLLLSTDKNYDMQIINIAEIIAHEFGHVISNKYTFLEHKANSYRIYGTLKSRENERKNLEKELKEREIVDMEIAEINSKYFEGIKDKISDHFKDMTPWENANPCTDAIYSEVFADLVGIKVGLKLASKYGIDKSNVFYSFAKFLADNQPAKISDISEPSACTYPIKPYRTNGVLTLVPEYLEWVKSLS